MKKRTTRSITQNKWLLNAIIHYQEYENEVKEKRRRDIHVERFRLLIIVNCSVVTAFSILRLLTDSKQSVCVPCFSFRSTIQLLLMHGIRRRNFENVFQLIINVESNRRRRGLSCAGGYPQNSAQTNPATTKILHDNHTQNAYSCIDVRAVPVSRHFVFQYQFTNAIVSITHSINMRPALAHPVSGNGHRVCHALIDAS